MTSHRESSPAPVPILVAAGGADWERSALELVAGPPRRVALVKRCLDLADLLATATAGTAGVAVVAADLVGLDADSVDRLRRDGVRTIAVVGDPSTGDDVLRARLVRLGVARVVDQRALERLVDHIVDTADHADEAAHETADEAAAKGQSAEPSEAAAGDGTPGRIVAVWGPPGAPGRTTVAIGLAAEAARHAGRAAIVDADPYGAGVGLALAVLEEVSGLLAAARLANAGRLEPVSLAAVGREVTTGLRLYTGLPRPDRWTDVRPQAFGELLTVAGRLDRLVVVDTGPSLGSVDPEPFASGPARDEMTRTAVDRADDLVVVGSADPVGLTRLARALPEVVERRAGRRLHVVVNRMRPTLGWSEKEVRYLVEGVAPQAEVRFLPDDRAAADRALVSGKPLTECGESPLRRAMAHLAEDLLAHPAPVATNGRRRLAALRRR